MATTARLIAKLSLDDSQFRRNMMSTIKLSDTVGAKMTKIGSTAIVGGFVAAAGGAALLAVALKKVTDEAADLQSSRASFEVMLGSVAKAKAMSASIISMANATPFGAGGLSKNVQTMLAFGVANDRVLPSLKMLGDVAGADQEKLDLLTLAFSQTTSAGKLMGQDLLQYVDAGFSPLQEISRTTGRSMADLRKDMEAGAISAEMVAHAFETATGAGGRFYGNMARQAKTWNGLLSNISSTWSMVLAGFGTPIIDKLSPMLEEWKDKLTTFSGFAPQIGQALVDDISGAFKDRSINEAMADLAGRFVKIMVAATKSLAKTIAAALLSGFADPLAELQANMQAITYMIANPTTFHDSRNLPQLRKRKQELEAEIPDLKKRYMDFPMEDRKAAEGLAAYRRAGNTAPYAIPKSAVPAVKARENLLAAQKELGDVSQSLESLKNVDVARIKKEILDKGGPQVNYGAGNMTAAQLLKEAGLAMAEGLKGALPKTANATARAIAGVRDTAIGSAGVAQGEWDKPWEAGPTATYAKMMDRQLGNQTQGYRGETWKGIGLGFNERGVRGVNLYSRGSMATRTAADIAKTSRSIWRGSRLAEERRSAAEKNDVGQNIKKTAETLQTMSADLGKISGRTGAP